MRWDFWRQCSSPAEHPPGTSRCSPAGSRGSSAPNATIHERPAQTLLWHRQDSETVPVPTSPQALLRIDPGAHHRSGSTRTSTITSQTDQTSWTRQPSATLPSSAHSQALRSLMMAEEWQAAREAGTETTGRLPSAADLRSKQALRSHAAASFATQVDEQSSMPDARRIRRDKGSQKRHRPQSSAGSALNAQPLLHPLLEASDETGSSSESTGDSLDVIHSTAPPDLRLSPAVRSEPLKPESLLDSLATPVRYASSEGGPIKMRTPASAGEERSRWRQHLPEQRRPQSAPSAVHASITHSRTEPVQGREQSRPSQHPSFAAGSATPETEIQPVSEQPSSHLCHRLQALSYDQPWPQSQPELRSADQQENVQPPPTWAADSGEWSSSGSGASAAELHQLAAELLSPDSSDSAVQHQPAPAASIGPVPAPRKPASAGDSFLRPSLDEALCTKQLLTGICFASEQGAGGNVEGLLQGHFAAQTLTGIGAFTARNGTTFEGQWQHNRPHGFGIATKAGHATFIGKFHCGLLHGPGLTHFGNGDIYAGESVHGLRHGQGLLQLADGSHYAGTFHQGRRTGLGMYAFVPGDCYWGSWEKGMMEGLGVYQHATGQIYEGTWRAGQKHGWGVLTTLEGHMWASLWEAGSARWRAPLQAPEERELGSLKAEALDVAQETARTARGIARSAAALQRSLKDPAGPLQVALRGHVGRARDAAEAARVAISLASDAAADLSSSEGRGPSPPG